jgi:hypothetical protein
VAVIAQVYAATHHGRSLRRVHGYSPRAPSPTEDTMRNRHFAFGLLLALLVPLVALAADNARLQSIADADQTDRRAGNTIIGTELRKRDAERRFEVLALLRSRGLATAKDYFNAALVFQHGDNADDYRIAHSLAAIASTLDPEHGGSRWLKAATWDRLMLHLGQQQWYGTQYAIAEDGSMRLLPMNPDAVSDEDRAAWNVPSLAEAKERQRGPNDAPLWSPGDPACFPTDFRDELIVRARKDRDARNALLANVSSKPLHAATLAIDRENTDWLRRIIRQCGWPRRSDLGEQAAHDVWLIAQHADVTPEFQLEAAAAMHRAALDGEASGKRVALLVDRHARVHEVPQTYGMQFNVVEGEVIFLPFDAPQELDERRRELGLPPFACWAAEVATSNKATIHWPEGVERSTCLDTRTPAP